MHLQWKFKCLCNILVMYNLMVKAKEDEVKVTDIACLSLSLGGSEKVMYELMSNSTANSL